MNTLPTLIRREFWEHRVLWMVPAAVAACYLLFAILAGSMMPAEMRAARMSSAGESQALFVGVQMVLIGFLYVLVSTVLFFYLADCLYAERRDRSILFWKSMPVSDSATVLSKLLVALIVTPIGVLLLSMVVNALAFVIFYVRLHNSGFVRWDTATWFRLYGTLFLNVLVLALWYAPIAAYQLLVSAWARSAVFVWTILPPLLLALGEKLMFDSWDIGQFLLYRLSAGMGGGPDALTGVDHLLAQISLLGRLRQPDLWGGVAVAAAFAYSAIRIRRYRDDT
ncbi:MAG: hypothetical protein IRZ28_05370 [Steroidobacteraceae bacterium]|nr:hypothetical protein [Steroidobacteraceae bacterium]